MSEEWQQAFVDRAAEVADDLERIVETLNDLVVDHLSAAVTNQHDGRPALDKDLQAARRAVQKAEHLLRRS